MTADGEMIICCSCLGEGAVREKDDLDTACYGYSNLGSSQRE